MTGPDALTWYCTGRGGHDPCGLTAVMSRARPGKTLTVVTACPVCGTGPKTLGWKVRQRLAAAGRTQVDVSALPF